MAEDQGSNNQATNSSSGGDASMPNVSTPQQHGQQSMTNMSSGQAQASSTSSNEKLTKINRQFKEKEAAQKAKELGIGYINIAASAINPDLLRLIPPEKARSALVLPFFHLGKKLRIAIADPNNPETQAVVEDLKKMGYAINVNLATDDGLLEAMKLYDTEQYKVKKEIDTTVEESKIQAYEKEIEDIQAIQEKIKTATSEEALYLMNVGAFKTGASDVHYEPEENSVTVRFRIDGILHKVFELDKGVFGNITNQIKYQCKMKLNITNEPQDGRFSFTVNQRKIDVRVSALPTQFGETFVLRFLDSGKEIEDFDQMGFSGQSLVKVKKLMDLKHGMILITGPTGSGKTTTLYTLLEKMNSPEKKIITLEDPIEYHLKGISQSQINEKRGYNFGNGLRSILRQDPDIVMIGEIRDDATAETAAQAALTGHILLSTLHTNSAIEAIPRLINIGLPPFMVAPALDTVIAQRLVRRFCQNCVEQKPIPKATADELSRTLEFIKKIQPTIKAEVPKELPAAPGCDVCSQTGYKKRVSIVELLDVDNEIKRLILEKSSSTKLIESARRKGFLTMYEDGILKVINGITSLQEVHRVTAMSV